MSDGIVTSPHALRRQAYQEWLREQGLRFGFATEIPALADRTKLSVQNDTPPEALWPNILPTVRLVEAIREKFGPTVVRSAYRSVEYNIAVYEEIGRRPTDSEHSRNTAIDFSCEKGTPAEWLAELKAMRAAGLFQGGLGLYNTFVHVDTRGVNAEWRG